MSGREWSVPKRVYSRVVQPPRLPAPAVLSDLSRLQREGRLLAPELTGARVLVVDDDEQSLLLLGDVLAHAGLTQVTLLRDSSEVVGHFERTPPDLLLLDVEMPAPDGYELMRLLSRWTTGETYVPILILTEDKSQGAKLRSLELGARDFLTKPLDPIEITLRIRNMLLTRKLQLSLQSHSAALGERVRVGERELHRDREQRGTTDDLEDAVLLKQVARALDRNELFLQYQPIATVRECAVIGVEALVRWEHPQHGTLAPGDFLPAVERSPLSWDVDLYVLERAVSQAREWQRNGRRLAVSVNVTAATLSDTRLPRAFSGLVEAHDLDPALIELEVTEGAVMNDPMTAAAVLHQLRDVGLGSVSLDDFGIGHSSLARLHELPLDRLKIDRAFLAHMEAAGDATVIRAVIAVGQSLGMLVVAEGVETEEGWQHLGELGCDAFQGYWLARPQPLAELEGWLGSRVPISSRAYERRFAPERRSRHRDQLRGDYYRAAFNAALDLIMIVDDDRRIVECNDAACAFLGLTRQELLRMRMHDFMPPERLAEMESMWHEFIETGQASGVQILRLPDGRTRVVEARAAAHLVPGHHISIMRPVDVIDRGDAD